MNSKRLLLFIVIYFFLSLGTIDETGGHSDFLASESLKPINKRLSNNLSDFNSASVIEYQVSRLMERANLKGVSIAIVKDEKLVYASAFGYADAEKDVKASPKDLYRIASVSKLITAVAIMQMVEEGRLTLDDKVFGKNGFFNDPQYLDIADPRLEQITIRNLLDHTSGWSLRWGDPAFNPLVIADILKEPLPVNIDSYIRYAISRRLSYSPGTVYCYSNMAYMFLGEIIRRVSGVPYEDYVKYHVLAPIGISDIHIGNNLYEDKFPNEVRYYEPMGTEPIKAYDGEDKMVAKTYGGNDIKLLGAAGGWIASASELARLMVHIDGFNHVPDIISKISEEKMTPQEGEGNPLGWKQVTNDGIWYRTGNYTGTSAMMCRRPDGFEWVFLTNTSTWRGPMFSHEINAMMNRILTSIDEWPDRDLFNYVDDKNKNPI
jgi:CubicO group peptidase (beta-lactamase class C family)